jgi:hypothetical protein
MVRPELERVFAEVTEADHKNGSCHI